MPPDDVKPVQLRDGRSAMAALFGTGGFGDQLHGQVSLCRRISPVGSRLPMSVLKACVGSMPSFDCFLTDAWAAGLVPRG